MSGSRACLFFWPQVADTICQARTSHRPASNQLSSYTGWPTSSKQRWCLEYPNLLSDWLLDVVHDVGHSVGGEARVGALQRPDHRVDSDKDNTIMELRVFFKYFVKCWYNTILYKSTLIQLHNRAWGLTCPEPGSLPFACQRWKEQRDGLLGSKVLLLISWELRELWRKGP